MELIKLPVLPLRSTKRALFPGAFGTFEVGRPSSLSAVQASIEQHGNRIIIAFQKSQEADRSKQLFEASVEASVKKIVELPTTGSRSRIRLSVSGARRGFLRKTENQGDFHYGLFEPIPECEVEVTPHLAEIAMHIQGLAMNLDSVSFRAMSKPKTGRDLSLFLDCLSYHAPIPMEEKMSLLANGNAAKRAEMLHVIMIRLVDEETERVLEMEAEPPPEPPAGQPARNGDRGDPKNGEVNRLRKAIDAAGMPPEAKRLADGELRKLRMMATSMSEFAVTLNYLDLLVALPWSKLSPDRVDLDKAERILDEDHYGLKKPKARILEYLSVRKLVPDKKGMILCFAGPPGVGKTSLGKSIAKATGREFVRFSMGGLSDEAELRGHRRTYIGAMPGKIIQSLKRVGTRNPVFMLDEVDKTGRDVRGDPQAALLEILDPEQNCEFRDNYVGTGFDLSQVMFITTVNDASRLHPALRDRMDVVDISGYSPFDKIKIAKHYLIPKQKDQNGLAGFEMTVSLGALSRLINEYTSEAGVRNLERECGTLMRKLAVSAARGKEVPKLVTRDLVRKVLGPPKIFAEKKSDRPVVGLSTGLAWTPHGGSILFIESLSKIGKGRVKMTGRLGEIMQESVEIVHSWIKSHAADLGIEDEKLDKLDIHVHVPSGATPKDGPSAGVAIAASIISLLSKTPVRDDVAVTGEVSLLGRVLPVGGIREKILAAHRAGIREVLIPEDNIHCVSDVPKEALEEITIRTMDRLETAIGMLICDTQAGAADKHESGENPLGKGDLAEATLTSKV